MKAAATILLTGTMLTVSGIGLPAYAGNHGNNQSWKNHSSKQAKHKMAGGEFTGKVLGMRTVTFNNGKKYVLAKVKDNQDHTAILDLGTVKNYNAQNANVKKGQQIKASGRSGRLNDKPILVVYTFSTNSQNHSYNSSQ
jgi:hypothetical protein